MISSEYLFRLTIIRQEQILREVEMNHRRAASRSNTPKKISPRLAWALVGPVFAIVVLSLIV